MSTPEVVPAVPPELQLKPALNRRADMSAQMIVLTVLFAAPVLMSVHGAVAADPDIWWHLRLGEWMSQNGTVPRVELFSRELAGKPWLAYSWLFELLTFQLFHRFGLAGIVGYTAGMVLAITVAMHHLIKRLQSDISITILLTFTTCYCLAHIFTPRPWLFSILFFVLELDILMQVRRTGRTDEMVWLPLIFALWANLHIEYIYGLFILGLALVESIAARWWTDVIARVQPLWMGCALLASLLATLANPFGWRIYGVVYQLVTQGGGLRQVSEMQALQFRDFNDFLLLFMVLASAGALAWNRRFRLFETGLLLFAAVMSFRSKRDLWVIAVVAACILASTIAGRASTATRLPRLASAAAVLFAALAALSSFRLWHVNNALLDTQVVNSLPERAVDEIKAKGYAGPLYNNFDWGGYLIWALRMPVTIDGRTNLYGNERMDRSIVTWNGQPDWASDPALKSAGLVVGPVSAPLTQVLRTDPHFKIVYEDKLAAVFIAQRAASK